MEQHALLKHEDIANIDPNSNAFVVCPFLAANKRATLSLHSPHEANVSFEDKDLEDADISLKEHPQKGIYLTDKLFSDVPIFHHLYFSF